MKIDDIMYRRAENELWIKVFFLLQLLPQLSYDYLLKKAFPAYRKSVQPCFRNKTYLPATGKAWRCAKINGKLYVEYSSIPDKAPSHYLSQLPTRKALIDLKNNATQQQTINPLQECIKGFINDYQTNLPFYGDCTKQQQHSLATAASYLQGCCNYMLANGIDTNNTAYFKQANQLLSTFDIKYLPSNYRGFRELLLEACTTTTPITQLVKLPRKGNTNAVQHSHDEEVASWILNMRYEGKNFTNAHIIRKVQWLCTISDKPVPSERWIGEQMETANNKFLTAAGRYGSKGKHGQSQRAYTPFGNALFAGDCWQVDGSRVNILNFKQKVTITDAATGKERKLDKETFISVVAVRDVHSGDVLGHSFNLAENRWTYMQALQMAVETAGYLPYEIVFDKFPGHNTPEFIAFAEDLRSRGVKITFTHKAEGKAKIERWFGTLQTVFMSDSNYFYGEGIQSMNKYAHRSKEYLKKLRKQANEQGWNWEAACDEANKIIEAYRHTKYSYYSRKFKAIEHSPAQVHEASEKPNVRLIEADQFAYLFGIKRKAKISNMGLIDFEVSGAMFNYRCANYDVLRAYDYVLISYLLDDMSTINIYELTDRPIRRHLGTANEIPNIVPYGTNAFEGYGKQQAIIKQMEDYRNQELEHRMAVGFDSMGILEQGGVNKNIYENESDKATIALITGGSDEGIDDYDVRDQY